MVAAPSKGEASTGETNDLHTQRHVTRKWENYCLQRFLRVSEVNVEQRNVGLSFDELSTLIVAQDFRATGACVFRDPASEWKEVGQVFWEACFEEGYDRLEIAIKRFRVDKNEGSRVPTRDEIQVRNREDAWLVREVGGLNEASVGDSHF